MGDSKIANQFTLYLWPELPGYPEVPSSLPKPDPDGPDVDCPITVRVILYVDGSWSCVGTQAGDAVPVVAIGGDGSEPEAAFFRQIAERIPSRSESDASGTEDRE